MEDMMTKTSYTTPHINDMFSLTNGVTLIQNGRTKGTSTMKPLKFKETGSIRMNKTDYGKL